MPESKSKKLLVYDVLKQRIITQAMKPGEPINEGILSQELDLSTTPIREAIQRLEREGFIENIPGKGNFVSPISIQDLRELFSWKEREIIMPVSGGERGQDRGKDPFVDDEIGKIIHDLISGLRVFRICQTGVPEKRWQGLSAAAGCQHIPERSRRNQAPVLCDT